MKRLTPFLAILAFIPTFASADIGPMSLGSAVDRDLSLKPMSFQTPAPAPTPPPLLQLLPGTYGVDFIFVPPPAGSKVWQKSACVSTEVVERQIARYVFFESDVLAGINVNHGALTAGWGAGLKAQGTIHWGSFNFDAYLKVGGAELFGSGISGTPGGRVAAGIVIH